MDKIIEQLKQLEQNIKDLKEQQNKWLIFSSSGRVRPSRPGHFYTFMPKVVCHR